MGVSVYYLQTCAMLFSRPFFIFCFSLLTITGMTGQIGSVIGSNPRLQKKTIEKPTPSALHTLPLAKKITRNCNSKSEKSAAIFHWIATHIEYDNELHNSKKLQKEFYTSEENVIEKVLERKKALCGGYAFLYQRLCKDVGIKVEVIHGFTKNFKPIDSSKPNHSWNAVLLNGSWQLLDITWAVSFSKGNEPSMFWYLTHPKDFIKSHYPQHTKWILLKRPISLREFEGISVK